MGIVIQYFPIPEVNKNLKVKNVTGAGDSLLGYLTARLLLSSKNIVGKAWLEPEINRIEDEWFNGNLSTRHKSQVVYHCKVMKL